MDTDVAVPVPDSVAVQVESHGGWCEAARSGVRVLLEPDGRGLRVVVASLGSVSRVKLRWHMSQPASALAGGGLLVLGDAWERSYGELEWRARRPEQPLPWMALVHDPGSGITTGYGVETGGGAFAFWQLDSAGVTLVLDLRCGGAPVEMGDRAVHAATVRWSASRNGAGGIAAFRAQQDLCALLCPDSFLPVEPVVGANNWYYAYGQNVAAGDVYRDARMIADLTGDGPTRPFAVVDDGWTPDGVADGLPASGGPWLETRPGFPPLAELAAGIHAQGARPGIWMRPLLSRAPDIPETWIRAERSGRLALDPTHPGVLDLVARDVSGIVDAGFDMVKHDFSTFDTLGVWGPDVRAVPTVGPAMHERSRTTAEALVNLYRTIHEAAGDAVVIGCNVVPHLSAGYAHIIRTGDDTSGRDWNTTRRTGVNTLAFRQAMHGRFYAGDPDCVASTPETDWEMNRRFLDLVARSGQALFVSIDPTTRSDRVDTDVAAAIRRTLASDDAPDLEPLDWLSNPTPTRWRRGDEELEYDWIGPDGADAFEAERQAHAG